ncbi:hypothetical protein GPL15_26770 [Clostridium sp. MCC353]|uniref:hypothetical protein n=1 Tax=Clostridium sp. MCC353 TaxID=2592646 RepID=UPI001C01DE7F|nr:hypothetical protein [Clostridium sp. MCC353]MBT9780075.1 hypothetical protein [Clostridium sp. MCC353]
MSEDKKRPNGAKQSEGRRNNKLWVYLPILLVFVSITSFIAGTRIGRDSGNRRGMMLDTIVLSPDGETAEEKVDETHIKFSGRILLADGTPCANQLLELHSDPMRTKTDSDGFFHFQGIEVGDHKLMMLDESEQVLSQISISVNRDNTVSYGQVNDASGSVHLAVSEQAVELHIQIQLNDQNNMEVQPAVYTRKPGESFRDMSGEETDIISPERTGNEPPAPESGENLVSQENVPGKTPQEKSQPQESSSRETPPNESPMNQPLPPESPPVPNNLKPSESAPTEPSVSLPSESLTAESTENKKSTEGSRENNSGDSSDTHRPQPDQNKPTEPETTAPTEPETPTEPEPTAPDPTNPQPTEPEPTEPTEPEPTEPEPTNPEAPLDVSVQEKGGPVWAQNTTISLFADRTGSGEDKKLMPGSKGSYEFLVSNKNTYGIIYKMKIAAPQEQLLLPLLYRLKSGGKYLCGDSKTWLSAEQLAAASVKLDSGMQKEYLLEWYWPFEGGDDAYDTLIGTADNLEYRLIVNIVIEQVIS